MIAVADAVLPPDLFAAVAAEADLGRQDEAGAKGLLPRQWERRIDQAVAECAPGRKLYARHLVTLTNRSAGSVHLDRGYWLAVLYLTAEWSINWGGDLLFIAADGWTIDCAVAHRPNRMVVFDGERHHVVRPPTAATDKRRVTLVSRYV